MTPKYFLKLTKFSILLILLLQSCANESNISKLHIKNSYPIQEDDINTHAVIKIYKTTDANFFCTGFFIDHQTLITAAHCLGDFDKGGVYIKTNTQNIESINAFYPKEFAMYEFIKSNIEHKLDSLYQKQYELDPTCSNTNTQNNDKLYLILEQIKNLTDEYQQYIQKSTIYDIAVVIFPPNTGSLFVSSNNYLQLYTKPIFEGSLIKIVGFGGDDTIRTFAKPQTCMWIAKAINVQKRQGFNLLSLVSENFLMLKAEHNKDHLSSIILGDSGGPWIICEDPRCKYSNKIIGISVASSKNNQASYSVGINISSEVVKNLFDMIKTGSKISNFPSLR